MTEQQQDQDPGRAQADSAAAQGPDDTAMVAQSRDESHTVTTKQPGERPSSTDDGGAADSGTYQVSESTRTETVEL